MKPTCPSENTNAIDPSSLLSSGSINLDPHRIGWGIAGAGAFLTTIITLISVWKHCRNYTKPNEQRQVLRIIYTPLVYAIVSFFSYRFFRRYTYYDLVETAYQAVTMSSFLLLLIEYVGAKESIQRKDKQRFPGPFCCWRYRPTKPYFMYTVKWSVMQYVIVQPAVTVAGIICEAHNVLCVLGPFSVHYANAYLQIITIVSSSIAAYGLDLFYGLTNEELRGRRPLAKIWTIKFITIFITIQTFAVGLIGPYLFKSTEYWTKSNIAEGLNALLICVEMVPLSLLAMWAYTWKDYVEGERKTSIWRPLWDSINPMDFFIEIFRSSKFYFECLLHKPHARPTDRRNRRFFNDFKTMSFGQAFGIEERPNWGPR